MANRYLALTIVILTSCPGAGHAQQYGLRGEQVTLNPNLAVQPENILWKHDGNKVVEFNGKVEEVYRTYKDRITLDWHSADLTITDLRFEDSGLYEVDAFIKGKELQSFHYQLQVIDKVSKPTISCEMNNGSSSNSGPVSGSLLCSAESRLPQSSLTYTWTSYGKVVPGPRLSISLGDEYDDNVYSCQVSNPLSSETATFTAKDCYPESISPAVIAVPVIISIVIIILAVLGLMYCGKKRKACFAEDSEKHPATDGSKMKTDKSSNLHRASTRPSKQPLSYQAHVGNEEVQDPLLPKGRVKETVGYFEGIAQREWKVAETQPTDTAAEHMEETQISGDNQQETSNAVSEEKNEPDNEGDDKEKENLSSAASQQPQSPTPTEQDNRNSKTFQESPITAHVEPDQDQDAGDPGSDSQSEEGGDGKALVATVDLETPPPVQPQPLLTTTQPPNSEPEDTAAEHEKEIQRGEDNQQETCKAGSEHENESDKEGDDKESKNGRNLSLAASQQPDPESDKPGIVSDKNPDEDGIAQSAASPETSDPTQPHLPLTESATPSVSPKDTDDEHEESSSVPELKVESQNVKTDKTDKTDNVGEAEEQNDNGTAQAEEGEGGGLPVRDPIQHNPKEEPDKSDCQR